MSRWVPGKGGRSLGHPSSRVRFAQGSESATQCRRRSLACMSAAQPGNHTDAGAGGDQAAHGVEAVHADAGAQLASQRSRRPRQLALDRRVGRQGDQLAVEHLLESHHPPAARAWPGGTIRASWSWR